MQTVCLVLQGLTWYPGEAPPVQQVCMQEHATIERYNSAHCISTLTRTCWQGCESGIFSYVLHSGKVDKYMYVNVYEAIWLHGRSRCTYMYIYTHFVSYLWQVSATHCLPQGNGLYTVVGSWSNSPIQDDVKTSEAQLWHSCPVLSA